MSKNSAADWNDIKKTTILWSTTYVVTQNAVGIFQHDSLCLKKKHKAVEPVLQPAKVWSAQTYSALLVDKMFIEHFVNFFFFSILKVFLYQMNHHVIWPVSLPM